MSQMLSRAHASALLGVCAWLHAVPARADERIDDPELTGEKPPSPKPNEAIADPELHASPALAATAGPSPARPEYPHDAIFRVTLGTRFGVDTQWTRPSQDVFEGTSIAVLEAEQRRSEALLLSVGLRARQAFGMRRGGGTRTELDVVPISAFADVTPAAGYHFRAGYQVISMGRFDLFTATNFLAVYDLRSGPVTMADASAVGQPALRFDFDKVSGLSLQAYYVPFFQPDLLTVYGSDYALLASVDRSIDSEPAGGTNAQNRALIESALRRSGVAAWSSGTIRAFAPAPDLTTPQGAVRATSSGAAGELSATFGTALERLPTVEFPAAPATLADAVVVHHDRFGVASVDAATDVGPVQLGFEAAYMLHRTLVGTGAVQVPAMGATPAATNALLSVGHSNLVQVGLRAEVVLGPVAAEIETFGIAALSRPADPRQEWMTLERGRYFRGVAGGVHFAPEGAGVKLELGGAFLTGPTAVLMPRVEWEAVKTLYLELGAVFVGGPTPKWNAPAGAPGAFWGNPNLSLGGLYNDVDQVFTGVRWVP